MHAKPPPAAFRSPEELSLWELDALRIVLRGGSVIDWHRLNFTSNEDIAEFLRVHECYVDRSKDLARLEVIKEEAVSYLKRHFGFHVPKRVSDLRAMELFRLATGKGHRQVAACIVLKVMHIIHHLQGRELLYILPLSDAEVFHLVEEKFYRVMGEMMSEGLPVVEFLGGRKNRDSLYTKLLSKRETIAAQIYDKLRFRIVTRSHEDLLPVVNYLSRRLFPFNYAIPGESTNTLVDFRAAMSAHSAIVPLLPHVQGPPLDDPGRTAVDNVFSAKNYRVIHFVVDLPIRVPDEVLKAAPATARNLGPVIFVLTEFQVVDQSTDQANELGDASHSRYKERQRLAVMQRLHMGAAHSLAEDSDGELSESEEIFLKPHELPVFQPPPRITSSSPSLPPPPNEDDEEDDG